MRRINDRHIVCVVATLIGAMSVGCNNASELFWGYDPPDPFAYLQSSVVDRPPESTTPHATPVANGAYAGLPVQSAQAWPSEPLSATSQAATNEAYPQQYCPVTGNKLGSMGPPIPVEAAGRTVYVCCAACVEKLKQNPQIYLGAGGASLSDGTAANATEDYRTSLEQSSSGGCSGGSGRSSSCCH